MNSGQKAIKIAAICLAGFIIINIVNAIFMGLSFIGGFHSNHQEGKHFVETYEQVKKIKLDINAASVKVLLGDELKVEATDVSNRFTSKVLNNNTLKIEEHHSWFWHHQSGEIILTIPQSMLLEELDIDCGAGRIDISNITAHELKLDAGAGLLKIDHSNFQETNLNGGAGEINISSSLLRNLDLDAGIGKVQIDSEIYGKSEINCGIGEVNLHLGNVSNYQFIIQKGIGSIEVNDITYNKDVTLGNGENIIKIEGGVGSIRINYLESKDKSI